MKLLLVRHGETVDNVAGNYAGVTDSALTNHGVLQAQRLGAYLKNNGVKTSSIFSSDLQRAFKTAEAIRTAQSPAADAVTQLPILREQDFGFYEGKRFYERPKDPKKSGKDAHLLAHKNDPDFVDVESKEAMTARATKFVREHLIDLMYNVPADGTVVVVAHGIILNHLWRAILRCFQASKVSTAPGVGGTDRGLEYLGGWSNTGFLELSINSQPSTRRPAENPKARNETDVDSAQLAISKEQTSAGILDEAVVPVPVADQLSSSSLNNGSPEETFDKSLVVHSVNNVEHLKGLKKARGGTGSLKHDSNQKTMDAFFKKRKVD